jgi:hypothetical protein
MPHPRRKSQDELMEQAFWTRREIVTMFRKSPKTIDKYINHPDPKKRLQGYMIDGTWMAEKKVVLKFFKYNPYSNDAMNQADRAPLTEPESAEE